MRRVKRCAKALAMRSLQKSAAQRGLSGRIDDLRRIVPDISRQETVDMGTTDPYIELKRRLLHAFQCNFVLDFFRALGRGNHSVVDIGDSAGTHCLYLKSLYQDGDLEALGVNLEEKAVERIRANGLKALLKRAEDLTYNDIGTNIDLYVTFEMVEHLHNPAIFFRSLAKRGSCDHLIVTVPFVRQSRVGLTHLCANSQSSMEAEAVHVFELSPADWKKIMLHGGWRVVREDTLLQYPRSPFFLRPFWKFFWRKADFEGFWAVELERDLSQSNRYLSWDE
jgi:SAM-dependent methyltransferase